jgi:hypothetical protein
MESGAGPKRCDASRSTAAARSGIRLRSPTGRAVVVAAVLGSALDYMSHDMLNVAVPSVAADLGGTVGDIQGCRASVPR